MGKAHQALLATLRVAAAAAVAAVWQEVLGITIPVVIILSLCRVARAVITVARAVKVGVQTAASLAMEVLAVEVLFV
jgi:hypothetical protein